MKDRFATQARRPVRCIFLFAVVLVAACEGTPPPAPDLNTVVWERYRDDQIGFSVEHPDVYETDRHHGGVLLRHDGYPVVAISYADEDEADRRGLWADHKAVGNVELAGITGKRYVYDHWDGPAYMHTVSFVIPWQGRYLALEFRTKNETLDPVQQRIQESFRVGRN